jgi:hypothetical protein
MLKIFPVIHLLENEFRKIEFRALSLVNADSVLGLPPEAIFIFKKLSILFLLLFRI